MKNKVLICIRSVWAGLTLTAFVLILACLLMMFNVIWEARGKGGGRGGRRLKGGHGKKGQGISFITVANKGINNVHIHIIGQVKLCYLVKCINFTSFVFTGIVT